MQTLNRKELVTLVVPLCAPLINSPGLHVLATPYGFCRSYSPQITDDFLYPSKLVLLWLVEVSKYWAFHGPS